MFIYITRGNEKKKINIHKYSSLYHLKEIVKKEFNIKSNDTFFLKHNGFSLRNNSKPIDELSINNGDNIECSIKIKGGTTFIQKMLIVILIIVVLFIVPTLLYTGFIPTILHITEIFVFKLFNYIACLILRFRRFRGLRKFFGFIIKATLYVIKCFYMYLASYVLFFLVYFAWIAVFKGMTDLFSMSSEYCDAIEQCQTMGNITAWTFVIVYALFKLPNIIYSSYNGFTGLLRKIGLGTFIDTFFAAKTIGKQIETGVDKLKWEPWYSIPAFGQIFYVFFGTFQTGIDFIQSFLSTFVGYGCEKKGSKLKPITKDSAKSFIDSFTKKISGQTNDNESNQEKKLSGKSKVIEDSVSSLLTGQEGGGNNNDLPFGYDKTKDQYADELAKYIDVALEPEKNKSARSRIENLSLDQLDNYYSKIKNFIKEEYSNDDKRKYLLRELGDAHYIMSISREKCDLLGDSIGECCTDEMFDYMKTSFTTMINNEYICNKLKDYGVYNYVKLLTFALDKNKVNKAVEKFNNTFVLFKLFDSNIIGVAAIFARILICNVFYISRFTNNVLFKLGSPMEIADTVKCGFFAGTVASIVFYFSIIYLPFTLLDWASWVKILVAILIYLFCIFIKMFVPYFPLPLIPL